MESPFLLVCDLLKFALLNLGEIAGVQTVTNVHHFVGTVHHHAWLLQMSSRLRVESGIITVSALPFIICWSVFRFVTLYKITNQYEVQLDSHLALTIFVRPVQVLPKASIPTAILSRKSLSWVGTYIGVCFIKSRSGSTSLAGWVHIDEVAVIMLPVILAKYFLLITHSQFVEGLFIRLFLRYVVHGVRNHLHFVFIYE